MLDRKLFPPTTLNLLPRPTKKLPHLATSHHTLSQLIPILSRLIAPYYTLSSMFDRKLISGTTLNLLPRLLKKLSHPATSYNVLSRLITHYPPMFDRKYFHQQF